MSLQCLRYTSDLAKRRRTHRKNSNFSKRCHAENAFSDSANVQRNSEACRYDFNFFVYQNKRFTRFLSTIIGCTQGKKRDLQKLPPDIIPPQIN